VRQFRQMSVGVAFVAVSALAASCASAPAGRFVSIEEFTPPASASGADAIQPGDLLDVRVLGQDQLSTRVHVRADGQVTLPFLNDVAAGGQTPAELTAVVERRLKEYVNQPVVAIGVEKAAPAPLSVLGEVARPGKYAYEPGMGLLGALAMAGGLTEYAHKDRLFVLRGQPAPTRIRFDFRRLLRAEGRGPSFQLEPGDVVVAE
jgi:polysaccharide biosynthesis/export protein